MMQTAVCTRFIPLHSICTIFSYLQPVGPTQYNFDPANSMETVHVIKGWSNQLASSFRFLRVQELLISRLTFFRPSHLISALRPLPRQSELLATGLRLNRAKIAYGRGLGMMLLIMLIPHLFPYKASKAARDDNVQAPDETGLIQPLHQNIRAPQSVGWTDNSIVSSTKTTSFQCTFCQNIIYRSFVLQVTHDRHVIRAFRSVSDGTQRNSYIISVSQDTEILCKNFSNYSKYLLS